MFEEKHIFEYEKGEKYNIICNHARFNSQRMNSVMTNQNTRIVTIMRDPLHQFESTAVYFNFYRFFNMSKKENVLEAFFKLSTKEIRKHVKESNRAGRRMVKNPITFDLGFDAWDERVEEQVRPPLYMKSMLFFHSCVIGVSCGKSQFI